MTKQKVSDKLVLSSKKNSKKKKSGYGIGMKMSLDLFSSILVGMMIGLGIDNFFSTKPVFLLIFLVLGIIAGFYSLYKSAQNLNKKD
jgi:ATP synthase protein I